MPVAAGGLVVLQLGWQEAHGCSAGTSVVDDHTVAGRVGTGQLAAIISARLCTGIFASHACAVGGF